MKNYQKYILPLSSNLEKSISKMVKEGVKTLVITDKNNLYGTLSDGDIRKLILKKISIKANIKKYVTRSPRFLKESYKITEAKKIFLNHGYDVLPVINKKRKIIEILTWNKVFKKKDKIQIVSKIKDIPVVIMAGGLGTRLLPYTNILPKPLLPFKGKSMIENVIDQFSMYSIKKILISINFKSEIIKAYFEQILKNNSNLSFIRETKSLGTCGPLAIIKKKFEDVIVINCDTLVNLNFNEFYNFHKKNNSHITIVTANKDTIIPYGVCNINKNGKVYSFNEKPKINYLANIGLYVINKRLIKLIPKNKKFNMDELISIALKKKYRISAYPILDSQWVDTGQLNIIKSS